jgi:hypothetical protein
MSPPLHPAFKFACPLRFPGRVCVRGTVSGDVYAWGLNLFGFLGVEQDKIAVPTKLPIPKGTSPLVHVCT